MSVGDIEASGIKAVDTNEADDEYEDEYDQVDDGFDTADAVGDDALVNRAVAFVEDFL